MQVIQEYVPLKRAGRRYKGLCPFHAEKTPSFHVDPDKGFFHCFGCDVGGDVFKFLELHEKVGFQDAVRMLAQKFGVALPEMVEAQDDDARRDARAARERCSRRTRSPRRTSASSWRARPARGRGSSWPSAASPPRRSTSSASASRPVRATGLKQRLLKQGFAQGLSCSRAGCSSSGRTARSSTGSGTG